jgi:hypothetical protein
MKYFLRREETAHGYRIFCNDTGFVQAAVPFTAHSNLDCCLATNAKRSRRLMWWFTAPLGNVNARLHRVDMVCGNDHRCDGVLRAKHALSIKTGLMIKVCEGFMIIIKSRKLMSGGLSDGRRC